MDTLESGIQSALFARMDKLRDELMARMDRLATTDSLTQLINRVASIERTLEDWPRRPADQERLASVERDVARRLSALEDAPKAQADKKSGELRNLGVIVGAIVAVISACNGFLAVVIGAGIQLWIHLLK